MWFKIRQSTRPSRHVPAQSDEDWDIDPDIHLYLASPEDVVYGKTLMEREIAKNEERRRKEEDRQKTSAYSSKKWRGSQF